MRLAWTAIVPRDMVTGADAAALARQGSDVLTLLPHPDPSLCVVRCFKRDPHAGAAAVAA